MGIVGLQSESRTSGGQVLPASAASRQGGDGNTVGDLALAFNSETALRVETGDAGNETAVVQVYLSLHVYTFHLPRTGRSS